MYTKIAKLLFLNDRHGM